MAAFEAKAHIEQSADGKTELFIDDSNYASNTDGVTLQNIKGRTVTSYLSTNAVFYNQIIAPGAANVGIPVVKDLAIRVILVITLANDSTRSVIVDYLSTMFYDIIQRQKANKLNCKCACKELCTAMSKAREFALAAITANLIGDRVTAQADIDAANTYINSTDCGC